MVLRDNSDLSRPRITERPTMQPFIWAPAHCQALREYRARGLSYGEIARRLNAKFGTTYTRNAALGRGMRMDLPNPERPGKRTTRLPAIRVSKRPIGAGLTEPPRRQRAEPTESTPAAESAKPVILRCVGITPRLSPLIELGPNDCRYPYGGDKVGEPITFCGHPKLPGSSYCAPHFHLTRGDETPPERAVGPVMLRLVKAA
jgi:GcrA cell cycle regulator